MKVWELLICYGAIALCNIAILIGVIAAIVWVVKLVWAAA